MQTEVVVFLFEIDLAFKHIMGNMVSMIIMSILLVLFPSIHSRNLAIYDIFYLFSMKSKF